MYNFLATIEAGYMPLETARVDIGEMLEAVLTLTRERARSRNLDIELHGGSVAVESADGWGTRVICHLPAATRELGSGGIRSRQPSEISHGNGAPLGSEKQQRKAAAQVAA